MEILKYLDEFLKTSYWNDENIPEQARALFTSYCLMENVDADTGKCVSALLELYENCDLESLDISYDEFENFMVGLIV